MSKKILVSGITLEDANIMPLLLKVKKWQELDNDITFFGPSRLKERIDEMNVISDYKFIELKGAKKSTNKISFILESARRNIQALFCIFDFKKKYDVVYSISSVLDMIIFPYCLIMVDSRIKWCVVFDNTVPLSQGGNKIIRFLACAFFHASLFPLEKASMIFAISDELKNFLLKKGFKSSNIAITGNAVEADLIKKAKKDKDFEMDLLFIGRINPAKGIYDMLKVIDILKKTYPRILLGVMGSGSDSDENNFNEKIKRMNLTENVQMLGFQSGIKKFNILKSSKCFIFLSSNESFGVALLEAVCSGVPSFVYDLPVYEKIYRNNEIQTAPIGDYASVAEKIRLFMNKGEFDNVERESLLNVYTWENIATTEFDNF